MLFLTRIKVADKFNIFQIVQVVADKAIVMDQFDDGEGLASQELIWMAQSVNVGARTDREAMLAHCKPVREYIGG
jgi:hypothetical protein